MKYAIKHLFLVISILTFWLNHHVLAAENLPKLPAYGADASQTSVSGLSSGAFMTAQIHVTYSKHFIGAGILAGGPYYCAGSEKSNHFAVTASTICMTPLASLALPDGVKLYENARYFAKQGLIDDVNHLKNDRIYMAGGGQDRVVNLLVVGQTYSFYLAAGVPALNMQFKVTPDSGHAISTSNIHDHKCSVTTSPYINYCGFFQSHELLKHIYGELNPPATESGKIISFNQREFIDSDLTSMSDLGFAYIPDSCETETCRVHVAFHGCKQGYTVIGKDFYSTTGYNEIAATNNIIVLYPQVQMSDVSPENPEGCWDFWGYSSENPSKPDFYTHKAPQMKAVMAMVARLTQPKAIKKAIAE